MNVQKRQKGSPFKQSLVKTLSLLFCFVMTLPAFSADIDGDGPDFSEPTPFSSTTGDAAVASKPGSSAQIMAQAPTDAPTTSGVSVQTEESPSTEKGTVKYMKKASDEANFLSLYIGVPHDEKVDYLPPGIKFDGDFDKVISLTIAPGQNTLRIRPLREGIATLIIKDKSENKLYEFRLDVKKSDLTKIVKELRSLLQGVDGITIRIVNNKVVVDGMVILPKELNRISAVIRQYGPIVDSIVELSPLAQKKIAEFIERDINNPEIQVRAINEKFILEGYASSADERTRAQNIADIYVPDVVTEAAAQDGTVQKQKIKPVINMINIKPGSPPPPSKVVQLVVHYVELNKSYQKSFRFQWMPDLKDESGMRFTSDSQSSGGVVSSITGIISNLLPKLNWAKTHGHARVLQSTSVLVQDGQDGNISSEGKIPYQTVAPSGGGAIPVTQFANVGLSAKIKPEIVSAQSDSVRLTIAFKVSSLVGMSSAGPQISENNVNTILTIRSAQSAAIGGLINNSTSTDYNRLPANVSSNPIISLYASKAFQRNQSQFVVFVTPVIKTSASAGSEKIRQRFRLKE